MTASVAQVVPRFVRTAEARVILGGRGVLDDCEDAGWIRPVHRKHRQTIFRLSDIHDCADRIEAGEYPEAK